MKKLILLPFILLFLGVAVSCNKDEIPNPSTDVEYPENSGSNGNNSDDSGSNGNNSDDSDSNDNNSDNSDPIITDSMYIAPSSEQNADTDTISFDSTKVKAVDLGLSVKWASLNIGATYTESKGTEFTWREVPNDWEDYENQTKYNYYELMKINRKDDTAQAFWGGKWRMPTEREFLELAHNCTWTKVDNHPNLIKVTGSNGNYIYFPAYEKWMDWRAEREYYGGIIYTSDWTTMNGPCEECIEFYGNCYFYSASYYLLLFRIWYDKYPVRPVMPK